MKNNVRLWNSCNPQFQRWDRAPDHCCVIQIQIYKNKHTYTNAQFNSRDGTELQTTAVANFPPLSPYHHHLYYWRYLEEAFKVIFFSFSIVAGDLYSNMCKYFWLGRTCQTVDSAQRGPSFMWSHEPGVLSVAQRYHRLWRVYHSYKPIQCQLHCAEQYWVFGCSPHLRGRRLWNNKLFNVPVNLSLLPFFTRSI